MNPEPVWYQPPSEPERFVPPRPEIKPGRPRVLRSDSESVQAILALERQINHGQQISVLPGKEP